MENKNLFSDKKSLAALLIAAASLVYAAVSFFLLPKKIYIQFINSPGYPETNRNFFLICGILLVIASALMTVFFEQKRKKWLATEAIVAILFAIGITVNYIL